MRECGDCTLLTVQNKEFALACKCFEHTFEPVLAAGSSLYYGIGFHQFIANFIYILTRANDHGYENMLPAFESTVRGDTTGIEKLLAPAGRLSELAPILREIVTFCVCHQVAIKRELDQLNQSGKTNWTLDLTTSALFLLLGAWGTRFDDFEVVCDQSKPLAAVRDFFDIMIGRRDRLRDPTFGHPLTFNLRKPIELRDSSGEPGLQIADRIASAICYAVNNESDDEARGWIETM